ncbi:hypothetical protein JKG47_00480 [Acidithiobacillus sp. MC6.1]|nr:hypothetical protein [Acidithiobacillus sp. MC6.1]
MYQSAFDQDRFLPMDLSGFPSQSIVDSDPNVGQALDLLRSSKPDPEEFGILTPLPVRATALARLILEYEGYRASMELDDNLMIAEAPHRDDPRLIRIMDRARAIWSADRTSWPETIDTAVQVVEAECRDIIYLAENDSTAATVRHLDIHQYEDLNETIRDNHLEENTHFLFNPNALKVSQGSQWMLPDPDTFPSYHPSRFKPPVDPYPMSEGERPMLDNTWKLLDQQNPPMEATTGPVQDETGPYRLVLLRDVRGVLQETIDRKEATHFGVAFREKPNEFWAGDEPFRTFDDSDTARRFIHLLEAQQNHLEIMDRSFPLALILEGVKYRNRHVDQGETREYYQATDENSKEPMMMSATDSWQIRRYLMTGELSPEMAQHFAQRLDSGATLSRFAESNLQHFAQQAHEDPRFEAFRKLEGRYYRNLGADLAEGQAMRNFSMDDMPKSLNQYVQDHHRDLINRMDSLRDGVEIPITAGNASIFATEQTLPLENSPLPHTVKAHVVIRPRVLRDVTQGAGALQGVGALQGDVTVRRTALQEVGTLQEQGVEFVQEGDVFRGYAVTQEAKLTADGDTFLTQPPIYADTHEDAMELAQDMAEKPLTIQHLQNIVERDTGIQSLQEALNMDFQGYREWLASAGTATDSVGDFMSKPSVLQPPQSPSGNALQPPQNPSANPSSGREPAPAQKSPTESGQIHPLAVQQLDKNIQDIRNLAQGLMSGDPTEQESARASLKALQERQSIIADYTVPLVSGILLNARNHQGEISQPERLREDVARLPRIVPELSPAETLSIILDGWQNDVMDKAMAALQVTPERHADNIAKAQAAQDLTRNNIQWPDQTISVLPIPNLAPVAMLFPLTIRGGQSLQADGVIQQAQPEQLEFVAAGHAATQPDQRGSFVRAFPDVVNAEAFGQHLESLGLARAALAQNQPFAMNGMEFKPVQTDQGLHYRASVIGQEQDQEIDPVDLTAYLHRGVLTGSYRSLMEAVGARLQHPHARADCEALQNGSEDMTHIPDWMSQANLSQSWPGISVTPPAAVTVGHEGQVTVNPQIPAEVNLGRVDDSQSHAQAFGTHLGPVESHIRKSLHPEPPKPKSETQETATANENDKWGKKVVPNTKQGNEEPAEQQNQKNTSKNDQDENQDQNKNQGQNQNQGTGGGGGFSLFGRRTAAPVQPTAPAPTPAPAQNASNSGDDAAIAYLQKKMFEAPVEPYHVDALHDKIKKNGLQAGDVDQVRELSARMDRDAKKASTPAERENLRKIGQAVDSLSQTVDAQPSSLEKEGLRKHLADMGKAIAEAIMRLFGLNKSSGMSGPS